jgi:hypothetical protein
MKRKQPPFHITQTTPTTLVLGNATFTVAIDFTEDGRGALLVIADKPDDDRRYIIAARQTPTGEVVMAQDRTGVHALALEHQPLTDLWAQWSDQDSPQKAPLM